MHDELGEDAIIGFDFLILLSLFAFLLDGFSPYVKQKIPLVEQNKFLWWLAKCYADIPNKFWIKMKVLKGR